MKRTQLIIATALLGGLVLSGCANKRSSESDKGYHLVTFMYNNTTNKGVYKNVVVMDGQEIGAPKNPNIENYVFEGWYTEPECKNEYKRWGLEIASDFSLYAKWSSYADLGIADRVTRFQELLVGMSSDAYKTVQECQAIVMYPAIIGDQQLFVDDKYVYNRYSDITIKDYYQYQEDESEEYYGQEQFSYDSRYFYDIYHSFDNPRDNEANQYSFDETKIESFMDIGFYNFFKTYGNNIIYYSQKAKTDEFDYELEFTGNYTELANINNGTYAYKEYIVTSTYSDNIGTFASQLYEISYGLIIKNGKITSASVDSKMMYVLGEDEVQEYVYDTSTYDFYYGDGKYPEYTGARF